jgi:hypothetical protein
VPAKPGPGGGPGGAHRTGAPPPRPDFCLPAGKPASGEYLQTTPRYIERMVAGGRLRAHPPASSGESVRVILMHSWNQARRLEEAHNEFRRYRALLGA